jgi:hypothetical protein
MEGKGKMTRCREEISLEGAKLVVFLQASRIHFTGSMTGHLVYPVPVAPAESSALC